MTSTDTPEAQIDEKATYADLVASADEGPDISPEDAADFQYFSGDEFLEALRERSTRTAPA